MHVIHNYDHVFMLYTIMIMFLILSLKFMTSGADAVGEPRVPPRGRLPAEHALPRLRLPLPHEQGAITFFHDI